RVHYLEHPSLAPLRQLMTDPTVSEIMINCPQKLFVERGGRIEKAPLIFPTPLHLNTCIESLVSFSGRAVNAKSPFVDFRLPDGSRVNVVIAPIALDGPVVTIRRAIKSIRRMEDIIKRGSLTPKMGAFLEACVGAHANIVFSGGTGSGKTTLLAMLSASINPEERVVVIEDTAELDLQLPHVVRMECRPPNMEGVGGITLADLLKNSLRMRPTRLILGEVRGEEAFDLLSAFSSGHSGGFAVVHASSPAQAVSRLELMVLSRGLPYPLWAIQSQISNAIDIIVQHAMMPDGVRRVTEITSVQGTGNDSVLLQDIFHYDHDEQRYICTGEEPQCMPRLRRVMGSIDAIIQGGPA
ncbi:MAG: CpaF family protein, partial [Polyangiaceae bacterium]